MPRKATVEDVQRILVDQSVDLGRRLHLPEAQFGLPVDGAGVRIRVSVPKGQQPDVPAEMEFDLDGETVEVPLEVRDDYEEMHAF